jgi:hypothetical protein
MDCPECGAHNPDDADFCNLCFKKFNEPEAPAARPPANESAPDVAAVAPLDVVSVDVPAKDGAVVDAEIPAGKAAPEVPASPAEEKAKPEQSEESPHGQDLFLQPPPGYQRPGTQPAKKGSFLKKFLVAAGIIAVVMVVVLVVLLRGGGGGTTFKSARGTLTFKYPTGWKEIKASEIKGMTSFDPLMMHTPSETILAGGDASGNGPDYVLSVVSVPNDFVGDWNAIKTRARTQFLASLSASDPSMVGSGGTTYLDPKYSNRKAGVDPAYSMKAELKNSAGDTATIEQVMFYHEENGYLLTLLTRNGAPDLAGKILDSVNFTITPPPTQPKQ